MIQPKSQKSFQQNGNNKLKLETLLPQAVRLLPITMGFDLTTSLFITNLPDGERLDGLD